MLKRFIILISILVLMAACVPATPGGTGPTATIPATNPPAATPVLIPSTPTPAPVVTEPAPTATHIPVDLTPAQRAAMEALTKDINVPVDQIKIVSTEAVQWPDGCLGVAIPGVMCTQMVVDGFRIILEANGVQYEYHTNQDGSSVVAASNHLSGIQIAVQAADGAVSIVDVTAPVDISNPPAFTGFNPVGGSVNRTAYFLNLKNPSQALVSGAAGKSALDFIKNATYGLAVLPRVGSGPLLAWGTQPISPAMKTELMISAPDGSNLETLLSEESANNQPHQIVAQHWSPDGKSLYFSKEPVGIGGYIPYSGASSLYKIDIASKQVTELIPFNSQGGKLTCLDALSSDERLVADHCAQNAITIRDLSSGQTTTIQPPAEVKDMRLVGSARFSPDNQRVAFAMSKGDPSAEQGWLAVSDSLSGASKLIMPSQPGEYFTVLGWLDGKTLLVQANTISCSTSTCENSVWAVPIDGMNPIKIVDGNFLTLVNK